MEDLAYTNQLRLNYTNNTEYTTYISNFHPQTIFLTILKLVQSLIFEKFWGF